MSGENLQELIYQLQTELVALERRLTSIIRRSGFYRLQGAAPDASINFQTSSGSGGITKIDRIGITTKRNDGADGLPPLTYNPATDAISIGAYLNQKITLDRDNGILTISAGNPGTHIWFYNNNRITFSINHALGIQDHIFEDIGMTSAGWHLARGVCFNDASDFQNTDYASSESVGVRWISSIASGGSISAVANARGGVRRLQTTTTTPTLLRGTNTHYSSQDAYRVYARFAVQQTTDCYFAVGMVDDVPTPGAGSLPYTSHAVLCVVDSAVNGNYLLRLVRSGTVTDIDTGVGVVAGQYHAIEIRTNTSGTVELYIDNVLKATSAADYAPAPTTMLRKCVFARNSGSATLAQLDIDCYIPVENRNTGTSA